MGKDKGKSEDEKLNEEPEITEIDEVFEDAATSRFGAGFLRWIITFAVAAAFAAIAFLTQQPAWGIVGVLGAAVLFSCMHVVLEWERTVVLRFGKFNRVAGPGLIFMIPFVEYSAATVDLRMRSTAFKAEHVLTSDLVPVDVDAVLFWMVWDAGKACSEIRNYERLVYSGGSDHAARRDGRRRHCPDGREAHADRQGSGEHSGTQDQRMGHYHRVG